MGTFFANQKQGGTVPVKGEPVLTASSPRGAYPTSQLARIPFDFDVTGVPLRFDGYRVRFWVNGIESVLAEPGPIFLTRVRPGSNTLAAEIINAAGARVPGTYTRIEVPFQVTDQPAPANP